MFVYKNSDVIALRGNLGDISETRKEKVTKMLTNV
jgi:hypothetical protein